MQHHIVTLAKQFIAIKSNPGNHKECDRILDLALSQLRGYTVEWFTHAGVRSALVYNTAKRPKRFRVLFNVHLDVIPGKLQQYVPRVKGDRLYGVGSMDMKGNAAAAILTFAEVAKTLEYPVALQLVTDEETGGFDGTAYQIDRGVKADFVIACEPTNFDIVNEAKGILWLKVSARGVSAHGAYPWRGENAIWKVDTFLHALTKRYPIPKAQKWVTTVNVSTVNSSNAAYNKIPDDCVVGLDIRFVPRDAQTVVRVIRALLPKGVTMEVLEHEPALYTDSKNAYVQQLQKVVKPVVKKPVVLRGAQGSSDARHFMRVNGAGIEFGPIGAGIGSDTEWVSILSLETYAQILNKFLLSL